MKGHDIRIIKSIVSTVRTVHRIESQLTKVYIDGSTVACKPTELCFLYTPDPGIRSGAYAPPVVGPSNYRQRPDF